MGVVGYIGCLLKGHDVYPSESIVSDAHAIQIPKGHGRLIDGDALIEQCTPPSYCVWMNEIEDAPTILEAEV